MLQYIMIPIQMLIHTSDRQNRYAVFNRWCFKDRTELTNKKGPVLHNWNKVYYAWRLLARHYKQTHQLSTSVHQPYGIEQVDAEADEEDYPEQGLQPSQPGS